MMKYNTLYADNSIKSILTIIISTFLIMLITINGLRFLFLNRNNDSDYNRALYIELLNKSLPIIQTSNHDSETDIEDKISIRNEFLKLLNLNIHNPILIMEKEISFFNNISVDIDDHEANIDGTSEVNDGGILKTIELIINPFKLNEGQVYKNPVPDEQANKSNEEINLPDKVVSVQNPSLKKGEADPNNPQILLYHTHTTETFAPNGNYTKDPSKNMIQVGEALTYELETTYGISVLHDKTIYNESMLGTYDRSRKTVSEYIKKYGDFKLVIDMHRDGFNGASKSLATTKMNGENVAKIMFVMAKKNPHYATNSKCSDGLVEISDKLFPGWCRGIHYVNNGTKYYNQDLSKNGILIEVGSQLNTVDEAVNSTKYMARIIAEYLNGKSE